MSVPLSSLLASGGALIGMAIASFFAGRLSAASSADRPLARASLGLLPALARAATSSSAKAKPCWMVKQPAMWAREVSKSIPFEIAPTGRGGVAVGYARTAKQAAGIQVNLATGDVADRFDENGGEDIERVFPTLGGEFRVTRTRDGAELKFPIEVPAVTPFAVGVFAGSIAVASPPASVPASLWPLEGDEGLSAASLQATGVAGYALVFRRSGAIWSGLLGADRKATFGLAKVGGSGGAVGKPAVSSNGKELVVIFADRPNADGPYQIRLGHAPIGASPSTTTVFPLPKGGPGGDAFAPSIAGLPDGRWLLIWTEGPPGSRAVRAQTLTPNLAPLGDPIALSPPAGNYGQGIVGVVDGYAATVFLSKGSSSYELWGAVLQCE